MGTDLAINAMLLVTKNSVFLLIGKGQERDLTLHNSRRAQPVTLKVLFKNSLHSESVLIHKRVIVDIIQLKNTLCLPLVSFKEGEEEKQTELFCCQEKYI